MIEESCTAARLEALGNRGPVSLALLPKGRLRFDRDARRAVSGRWRTHVCDVRGTTRRFAAVRPRTRWTHETRIAAPPAAYRHIASVVHSASSDPSESHP